MSGRVGVEQTPDIEAVLAETLTLAVLHYYGYTDEQIAEVDKIHPGRICREDECFDEDGESIHGQCWFDVGATANTVVEAVLPALAPVLAAAVREARAAELREAADECPFLDPEVADVVIDWLRQRAEEIDNG